MDTILLTGKETLFPEKILQYIGESYKILRTGDSAGNTETDERQGIRTFHVNLSDSDFQKMFELGGIRAVWYTSSCADGGRAQDETLQLDKLLQLCSKNGVGRLIVLTESADLTPHRELIDHWQNPGSGLSPVKMAVIRLPLLTGSDPEHGRMNRIFRAMRDRRIIRLSGEPGGQISILPVHDLASLLLRMTGETWFEAGIYAADGTPGRLDDFGEILRSLRPDTIVEYSKGEKATAENISADGKYKNRKTMRFRIPEIKSEDCDGLLGEMYLLPASTDWRAELSAQYAEEILEDGENMPPKERISRTLREFGKFAFIILDIAVMFLITEYLSRITSDSVYFKIVDVRILFVILMGMMHGFAAGFAAAFLECVMLVIRYSEAGISGLLLFYNVENWIPFVYYLTGGVISGYSHKKKEQEMRSVSAENELIRNKYLFLNDAYRTSVSDRQELRAQILSEEESYARLYSAIRKMAQRTPEAVCVAAVKVMRELLHNDTISIYQMDSRGREAEILSCCREGAFRQTLTADHCPEMIRVIQSGETWKNTALIEGVPMYAALVNYARTGAKNHSGKQEISLIVTVEHAGRDQLNQWYMNHFTILGGLFGQELENAAVRERTLS